MDVFWVEQRASDVPREEGWLSEGERLRARSFLFPKRAADWRLGRWTAKQAVARCFGVPQDHATLASIEIVPADTGAPMVFCHETPAPCSVSLSHRDGRAVCALVHGSALLGCDIELVEARSDAFLADYFTPEEQKEILHAPAADRAILTTLYWSAKESALKALQEGLRLDTRSVSVLRVTRPAPWSLWSPLRVRSGNGIVFEGWWRADAHYVCTVMSNPGAAIPLALTPASRYPSQQRPQRGAHAFPVADATVD